MAGLATFAPDFTVLINDAEIPAGLRASVTTLRYEDGVPTMLTEPDKDGSKAADRIEIEFANPNLRWLGAHIRGLGFRPFPTGVSLGPVRLADASAGNAFDLENTVSLKVGYAPGQHEHLFLGEVTGVQADFPESGVPTMTLVAHDFMNRLARGSISRGFSILPDFVIAAILGAENLLLPMIDPVIIAESTATAVINAIFKGSGRKQPAQSDLELLREIANTYDADFWVGDPPFDAPGLRGRTLYLSRFVFREYEPRLTLTWGESLISFTPRVSTIGQVVSVAIRFTLPLIPICFVVVVGWDFDRESLTVSMFPGAGAVGLSSVTGGVMTIIDRTLNNPADITNSALLITRMLRTKINNRLTGSGSAVGDPRIRAGAVIRLDGLGPSFSGDYRVTSAAHTIDAHGYRTDFKVRRELIP